MTDILLRIDPLLCDTLSVLAAQRKTTRAVLLRDCIYTAVWNMRRRGAPLRAAPRCPKMMEEQPFRVLAGKLIRIGPDGLELESDD